jgi:nicotinamidase-related amidase
MRRRRYPGRPAGIPRAVDQVRPTRPEEHALLVVDVLNTFDHADGDVLLRRFADRAGFMEHAIARARRRGWRVVYVNDRHGADSPEELVERALAGPGALLVEALRPRPGDPVVLKPSYSGFDDTDLASVLRSLGIHRVAVMGAVTEMCVAETAGDAIEAGWPAVVLRGASVPLASTQEEDALASLERAGVAVVTDPDGAPRG